MEYIEATQHYVTTRGKITDVEDLLRVTPSLKYRPTSFFILMILKESKWILDKNKWS